MLNLFLELDSLRFYVDSDHHGILKADQLGHDLPFTRADSDFLSADDIDSKGSHEVPLCKTVGQTHLTFSIL